MTPIMWWGLIASDFLAKPAKLASRWRHNFSLVPELQMLGIVKLSVIDHCYGYSVYVFMDSVCVVLVNENHTYYSIY